MKRRSPQMAALALLFIAIFAIPSSATTPHGIDHTRFIGDNGLEFAHVMDMYVHGDLAFASIGLGAGFQVYDISSPPSMPRLSSSGASAWRSIAVGDTAYSFCHNLGIQVFDVSSMPATMIGSYDPPDPDAHYEGGVQIGNSLYVAAHRLGVHVLDVTDLDSITHASTIQLESNACWNVMEQGGYLYAANGAYGLSVIDLSGTPAEVATLSLPGLANDLETSGNSLFLSLGASGIASVDITIPTAPVLLDTAPTYGNAAGIGLLGDILVVGANTILERFDVSNPANLVLSGWDVTKTWAMGADIGVNTAGDTVIAVGDWQGVSTYFPEDDPGGDIDAYPLRLDFGSTKDGIPRDTTIYVLNNGAGTLVVDSANTPASITAIPETFTLGPGESQAVTVTATGTGSLRGKIRWYSDDVNEAIFTQFVYKSNTTFPQVGSIAPDFSLQGTDGQTHSISGNAGKVIYLEFGANW